MDNVHITHCCLSVRPSVRLVQQHIAREIRAGRSHGPFSVSILDGPVVLSFDLLIPKSAPSDAHDMWHLTVNFGLSDRQADRLRNTDSA